MEVRAGHLACVSGEQRDVGSPSSVELPRSSSRFSGGCCTGILATNDVRPAFVDMLNELRVGQVSDSTAEAFRALDRPLKSASTGPMPTELFPLRQAVMAANDKRLHVLRGPEHEFIATDVYDPMNDGLKKRLDQLMAPPLLKLKTGAQVMLIRNCDESRHLVNGTIGRVCGFFCSPIADGQDGPLKDIEIGENKQVIHPLAKGSDGARRVLGSMFTHDRYPYVEFFTSSGPVRVLVTLDEFKVEDSEGQILARRHQVPLILAWALSIHKSQGQTIERLVVDLEGVFERGSLSRT